MKKILSLCLVAILILGLCACGSSETKKEEGLQVGFNRQSVTPTQQEIPIAGGDSTARLSTGFMDEVASTCIAIAKDGQTFLIFTMDFMILYENAVTAVKTAVTAATGVPESNIILNCTHTHSAPNIYGSWSGADAYRTFVGERSAKAATKAIEDLSPATVEISSCETEGLSFVRHYRMNDGTTYGNGHGSSSSGIKEHMYSAASELQAIKFVRAAEDKKDILMLSFPAHATTVNGTNKTLISACWPGATRAYVEQNSEVHCAIFQGASGDQVPDSKIDGLSAAKKDHKKYGQILGDYALGLTFEKVEGDQVILKSWSFTGNSMKEGTDDPVKVGQAQEINALSSQKGSSSTEVSALVAKYGFYNVYEATGLVTRVNSPVTRTMTLNVLQLGGDAAMVFAPYEMFGMHGEAIKEGSPFTMDFIVTCSEIYQGYFPHLEGCEEGFYEYDVTKYERGTGEKLAETFAATLTEMKSAG